MLISKKKYLLLGIIALIVFSGCSSSVRYSSVNIGVSPGKSVVANSSNLKGQKLRGIASYYADKFHGRTTANGEIFDMNGLTAAHKTIPFGTKLRVRNLSNNRTVIVKVNDRGPFVGDRIIDLSKGAAEELDMIRTGTAEVEIVVVE